MSAHDALSRIELFVERHSEGHGTSIDNALDDLRAFVEETLKAAEPAQADIELLKMLLTGGSSREWERRPDYGEDVEALFDQALADALAWECYSCREDVGWVKWSVAERRPAITEPGGYSYTIHIECGHCGSTNYFDADGNDVGED